MSQGVVDNRHLFVPEGYCKEQYKHLPQSQGWNVSERLQEVGPEQSSTALGVRLVEPAKQACCPLGGLAGEYSLLRGWLSADLSRMLHAV